MIIQEPEEPQTSREWKAALQRVKSLYLKNQWKQCAARCNKLLGISDKLSPLYVAFLHFYTALSNEAIARSTHNLSTTKIPLLEEAKRSYQAASRIMPTLEDPLAEEQTQQQYQPDTHADKSYPSSASSSGISTPKASPPNSPTYPSSASSTCSLSDLQTMPKQQQPPNPITPSPSILSNLSFSTPSSLTPTTKTRLRPSPLRIIPPTTPSLFPNLHLDRPHTPPAQIIPSDPTNKSLTNNRPLSVTFSTTSTLWLQNRSLERYHTHLITFANMLIAHIEVVEGLMQSTEEAQAMRPGITRSRSGWFGGGDADKEEGKRREVRARVERGRARGWRRERFAPERYQELCARALGEL